VFFTLTVVSTVALGIFCRKRNTVFALQKCEQRDYAAAADDDDDEEDWGTDCDSTTSQTVVTHTELRRHSSQRRRRDFTAAPTTPDLSLFCTSQTGKANRTGSSSRRREKVSRRAVSEVTSSWLELNAAATLSTSLPVECTDDDTDDDVKYRVTRDVMSVNSLLRCDGTGTSGLYDSDASRFQRSTSLDADVCRFVLTLDAASSQPLMTPNDCSDVTRLGELHDYQLTDNCPESDPCYKANVTESSDEIEHSTFEQLTCDDLTNHHDAIQQEPTT